MYPRNGLEKAKEAELQLRVASLRMDLVLAEEELRQYIINQGRRNGE